MSFDESEFVRLVAERAAAAGPVEGLCLGIGDDAALLDPGGRRVVATTDMVADGIDFTLSECGPRRAGRKALARALSDLAAMGVEPWCAFLSAALPAGFARPAAEELLDGLFELARQQGCALAGGDTKLSPAGLVLDVTALGRERRRPAVRRDGARDGDLLLVSGRLGGAALGRHLDFAPRVAEGLALNERHQPSAMMDLSDGLSLDLARLCAASGVGAEVAAQQVPVAEAAARLAARSGRAPLDHALHDGEDYELLFTLPAARLAGLAADPELGALCTVIGTISGAARGIVLRQADGAVVPLEARGFLHRFAAPGGGAPGAGPAKRKGGG